MKKLNWVKIEPRKISKNSLWVKCQHKLVSEELLAGLAAKFSQKSVKTSAKTLNTKKYVDSRILDRKSAHAISILLGSTLKRVSYQDLKLAILRCDTSNLNSFIIEQLIKYLPSPEQLKRLQELNNSCVELTEAEKFTATIGEIDQLVPRLHSLNLKLCFADIAKDIESDIVAGTVACEEVERSEKFARILELILSFGNYLNSGSINSQAFGFELSSLIKLKDTKDIDNKQTLLHYIVETIEKKFPELLSFGEELPHLEEATRISREKIDDNMQQITTSVENLNMALEKLKEPQSSVNQIREVMGETAIQYNNQVKALIESIGRMEHHYKKAGEYFAFDPELYPMEAFFLDIQTFKGMFAQAQSENTKVREKEDKIR